MLALDVTDYVHDLGQTGLGATLIDDGEVGFDRLGDRTGADHPTNVRRDDHDVRAVITVHAADFLREHGRGKQVVGRDVEEALDLARVQVEGQHPVGSGGFDQVGDQTRRDGRARRALPVLSGVAIVGNNRGDPPGRPTAQGVDRNQQLHQVVVGGVTGRLDQKDVFAPDVLLDLDVDFFVIEPPDVGLGQADVEVVRNSFGQRTVGVAAENTHRFCSGSESARRAGDRQDDIWHQESVLCPCFRPQRGAGSTHAAAYENESGHANLASRQRTPC